MSISSNPSLLSTYSIPKIISKPHHSKVTFPSKRSQDSLSFNFSRTLSSTRLNAGLTEIEPDLLEEKRDRWATGGIAPEDFIYGKYDEHHTYFEGEEEKGLISWLFLPAVASALAFHVPGEYLYIGAAVFVVVFCIIEMDKPDKPHNFEPQIYNMKREARDKLMADYNTMDIWDFNEKYGELWDFTVNNEDIVKT